MAEEKENVKELFIKHLIHYGFFFPAADIYGGVSGFYDYGPLGCRIKDKFVEIWKEFMIYSQDNMYQIDGTLILPFEVLKASGHVDHFTDPLVVCKKCGKIYRADKLLEDLLNIKTDGLTPEELNKRIVENNVRCPSCGGELSEVKLFNLMFKVQIGAYREERIGYLRPETAQSIFINFLNVYWSQAAKLPFAIYQIGKAFRNEISPRMFLFRLREFYQMEIEHFVARLPNCNPRERPFCKDCKKCMMNNHPKFSEVENVEVRILTVEQQKKGEEIPIKITVKEGILKGIIPNEFMGFYLAKEWQLFTYLGIPEEDMRFRQQLPEELAHYSVCTFDLEIKSNLWGKWIEVAGNAYRTDYDIKNHSEKSGKDMAITLEGYGKIYPHVIEPSFGIERPLLLILEKAFVYDKKDRKYPWLKLHPRIAPYLLAVFPLVSNKKEIVEKAKEVYNFLKKTFKDDVVYWEKDSIGKRYAKADSIGIPYCVTIDYQTLEDDTVTIRFRDTKGQIRVKIEEIPRKIKELVEKYPSFS